MRVLIVVLMALVLGCAATTSRPSNYELLAAYLQYEAAETEEDKHEVLTNLAADVFLQIALADVEPTSGALMLAEAALPEGDPGMVMFLARLLTALEEQPAPE